MDRPPSAGSCFFRGRRIRRCRIRTAQGSAAWRHWLAIGPRGLLRRPTRRAAGDGPLFTFASMGFLFTFFLPFFSPLLPEKAAAWRSNGFKPFSFDTQLSYVTGAAGSYHLARHLPLRTGAGGRWPLLHRSSEPLDARRRSACIPSSLEPAAGMKLSRCIYRLQYTG
ncbi:hypothetical protein HDV57DRAFT_461807 [Trichoderma longibrachiatum]